jgi:hypothetical protein
MESITHGELAVKGLRGNFQSNYSVSPGEVEQADLSPGDRRLLLISTLGLYLRRLRHGIPVTREDISRLANYGDVVAEQAANDQRVAA